MRAVERGLSHAGRAACALCRGRGQRRRSRAAHGVPRRFHRARPRARARDRSQLLGLLRHRRDAGAGPSGAVADRIGFARSLLLAYVLQAAAVATPIVTADPLWLALSSIVVGAFTPGITTLVLGRVRELVPHDAALQRSAWGIATIGFAAGQGGGAYLFSYLFARSQSYALLFEIGVAAIAAALVINLAASLRDTRRLAPALTRSRRATLRVRQSAGRGPVLAISAFRYRAERLCSLASNKFAPRDVQAAEKAQAKHCCARIGCEMIDQLVPWTKRQGVAADLPEPCSGAATAMKKPFRGAFFILAIALVMSVFIVIGLVVIAASDGPGLQRTP